MRKLRFNYLICAKKVLARAKSFFQTVVHAFMLDCHKHSLNLTFFDCYFMCNFVICNPKVMRRGVLFDFFP